MQCKHNMTAYAIALLAMASAFLVVPIDDVHAESEQHYDVDYGTFYSYTLQFVFDGKDAETIEWDFGDGSPVSDEWNPTHTYSEKGTYYVTQTTTNSYNGGSTTVEVYKVVVAGFPVISFEENGGSQVPDIQLPAYRAVATEPSEPIRQGHTFDGWFTDSELTEPYDWSSEVTRSITLHAKWAVIPVDPDSPGDDPDNPGDNPDYSDPTDPDDPGDNPGGSDLTDPDDPVTPDDTDRYTVTFDVDGGSVTPDPIQVDKDSEYSLPDYNGVRDGFVFDGWMVGSEVYQPGQNITVTFDITVEAVWSSDPSDDGDDGDGGSDDGTGDGGDSGSGSTDDTDNNGSEDPDYLHLALVILGGVCLVVLVIGSRRH